MGWIRRSRIERDLRNARQAPAETFVTELASRIEPARSASGRSRLVAAGVLTAALVILVAALGGLSSSTVSGPEKAIGRAVGFVPPSTGDGENAFRSALGVYEVPPLTIALSGGVVSGGVTYTNSTSPTFTGGCESNSADFPSAVSFTSSPAVTLANKTCTGAPGSGTYSVTATNTLTNGTSYTVTAHQHNGGDPEVTKSVTFTVDTTPPAGLTIIPAGGSGHSETFSGQAGHAAGDILSVTVVVCAVDSFPCASPEATVTGTVDGTGAWSASGTGNLGNNKTHFAQVTQKDAAGNTSTATSAQFTT